MFQHSLPADGKCLKSFDKEVAQKMVELLTDDLQLLLALFRKGIAQVLHHHTFSVAYYPE